jgi:pimeloyl-ACP methyl ester carboxylesterase
LDGASTFVHSVLELDYIMLSMPLMWPNHQHGYPYPHNSFYSAPWAGEHPIRYFVEPTALAVNYGLAVGYDRVHVMGLSGGGWATTLYAAIDPRVQISIPAAGSLPWYLFGAHTYGDFEQREQPGVADWFLSQANYTELYLLAALEEGRYSVQILHENDPVCFHARTRHAAILGYGARIAAALNATSQPHGTFLTAVSDWNQHEWDERTKTIAAAALGLASRGAARASFDRLPCDILHHPASAVPCPWPDPPAPSQPPLVEGAAPHAFELLGLA